MRTSHRMMSGFSSSAFARPSSPSPPPETSIALLGEDQRDGLTQARLVVDDQYGHVLIPPRPLRRPAALHAEHGAARRGVVGVDEPPIPSMSRAQTARPRPVPLPGSLVVTNGSNTWSISSGGRPGPLSATTISTTSPDSSPDRPWASAARAAGDGGANSRPGRIIPASPAMRRRRRAVARRNGDRGRTARSAPARRPRSQQVHQHLLQLVRIAPHEQLLRVGAGRVRPREMTLRHAPARACRGRRRSRRRLRHGSRGRA
jgi:hypothetical protein